MRPNPKFNDTLSPSPWWKPVRVIGGASAAMHNVITPPSSSELQGSTGHSATRIKNMSSLKRSATLASNSE